MAGLVSISNQFFGKDAMKKIQLQTETPVIYCRFACSCLRRSLDYPSSKNLFHGIPRIVDDQSNSSKMWKGNCCLFNRRCFIAGWEWRNLGPGWRLPGPRYHFVLLSTSMMSYTISILSLRRPMYFPGFPLTCWCFFLFLGSYILEV